MQDTWLPASLGNTSAGIDMVILQKQQGKLTTARRHSSFHRQKLLECLKLKGWFEGLEYHCRLIWVIHKKDNELYYGHHWKPYWDVRWWISSISLTSDNMANDFLASCQAKSEARGKMAFINEGKNLAIWCSKQHWHKLWGFVVFTATWYKASLEQVWHTVGNKHHSRWWTSSYETQNQVWLHHRHKLYFLSEYLRIIFLCLMSRKLSPKSFSGGELERGLTLLIS